jgi:DNA-binding HxlR family transcriptional regulator
MQRTPLGDIACSIARTFDVVGEPWTALILRDVYAGITRFEGLQHDLGLSRKVLADRLHTLVAQGVLHRRPYQDSPPRHDYLLTAKGEELVVALLALLAWGDRWADGGAGPPVLLRHQTCGHDTRPLVSCSDCREPLLSRDLMPHPGPGARPGRATRDIGAAIKQRSGSALARGGRSSGRFALAEEDAPPVPRRPAG